MTRAAHESAPQAQQIDVLFTAVQLPGAPSRSRVLHAGWSANLLPSISLGDAGLSTFAKRIKEKNSDIPIFPYANEIATYTPSVLEFKHVAQPVDNPDSPTEYTQDVIVLSGMNDRGGMGFIHVPELILLDAIERGQMELTVGGRTQYSLLIPDDAHQKLNIVLFGVNGADSNEYAYRTFLFQTIKSLVDLDRAQDPPDQKKYLKVIAEVVRQLRGAYSGTKSKENGLEKIALDMGVIREVAGEERDYLGELSVAQFRDVLRSFHINAAKVFARGR